MEIAYYQQALRIKLSLDYFWGAKTNKGVSTNKPQKDKLFHP